MRIDDLGVWILNFLNSDPFLDWLFTSIFGLFLWWVGSRKKENLLSLPIWPTSTVGRKQERLPYIRSFVMEVMGLLLMVWSLLLAFITTSHEQRLDLFWGGMLVLVTLGAFLSVGMELKERS